MQENGIERLLVEAYQNLSELGLEMSYNDFVKWLNSQIETMENRGENNESTTK